MKRAISKAGIRAAALLYRRSTCSILLLLSYLIATIGYPLIPVKALADKASGEPFPCQFSTCGCQTLEQCRVSCCCHSKKEKVVWALQRGIDPGRVAILSAVELASFTAEFQSQSLSCCNSSPEKSCCSKPAKITPPEKSCCSSKATSSKWKFVHGIAARKCRGSSTQWLQAGFIALVPPPLKIELPQPIILLTSTSAQPYFSPTLGHLLRPA